MSQNSVNRTKKAYHYGRAYLCLHCSHVGTLKADVKQRLENHIMRLHYPLDKATYYCSLCQFRCEDQETLDAHVGNFSRHRDMVQQRGITDSSVYLRCGREPTKLQEGTDFRVMTKEESMAFYMGRSDSSGVQKDMLSEAMEAVFPEYAPSLQSPSVVGSPQWQLPIQGGTASQLPYPCPTMRTTNPFMCWDTDYQNKKQNGALTPIFTSPAQTPSSIPSAQVRSAIPPTQMSSFLPHAQMPSVPIQAASLVQMPSVISTNQMSSFLPQVQMPSVPIQAASLVQMLSVIPPNQTPPLTRQTSLIESQARAIRCLEKKVQEQSDILASTNIILKNLVTLSTRPTGGQENKDRRSPVKPSSRPAKVPRREERRDDRVRSVLGKSYTNTRVNYNNRR